MGRSYADKVKKRKRANEKYDREEENIEEVEKEEENIEEAEKEEVVSVDLEGIPLAPSEKNDRNKNGVIFILEKASLEVGKVGNHKPSSKHGPDPIMSFDWVGTGPKV
ncbi:hypothetical protein L484_012238 [Morus notabilis]|uniref:Uncharacterized protein n=1 Tax=Morus notabilis TaxID=981085 RepID=W9RA53_9ROSA|nr:hypothetical protein L484_012238 [Morus notabilis]